MDKNPRNADNRIVFSVLSIPTIMLIIGYFIYPFPPSDMARMLIQLPIFLGLILLGIGFLWREKRTGGKIKILGWLVFAFFWATSPNYLYLSEGGDIVNAVLCILGVYLLVYIAYHEWLSLSRGETVSCLNWFAGATFLAGIIYFTIDSPVFPAIKNIMIEMVASQTSGLLNFLGLESFSSGPFVYYQGYPIMIIFSCTAVQSMVLFVGMIVPLNNAVLKRKIYGLLVTIPPIYFLNLIRTSSVIYLAGGGITSVEVAHNIIGKTGSLIALVVFAFIIFRILPELYDEIVCIIDLPKRKGPVENFFINLLGKKKDENR
ncbi:MAG: archaeosortase A [Thermoplasmatales archaeon]|nr:MAG: archaeosortase A [Thermoplasmatales archaeon]